METNTAPGGVQPAGDSTALLAEFGRWLGRERGLSLVSVQCYSKQSKAFLTWIGGGGSLGRVVADVLAAPRHEGRGDRPAAGRLRPGHGDGPAGLRDLVAAGPAGPGRPWPPG